LLLFCFFFDAVAFLFLLFLSSKFLSSNIESKSLGKRIRLFDFISKRSRGIVEEVEEEWEDENRGEEGGDENRGEEEGECLFNSDSIHVLNGEVGGLVGGLDGKESGFEGPGIINSLNEFSPELSNFDFLLDFFNFFLDFLLDFLLDFFDFLFDLDNIRIFFLNLDIYLKLEKNINKNLVCIK
jgi:hypothetical protein